MKRTLWLSGVALAGHLAMAVVSDVAFGTHVTSSALRGAPLEALGRLAFFGAFAVAPMALLGRVGAGVQRAEAGSRAVRWMVRTGGAAAVATSLLAQLACWAQLHTDAQAAVLFLFLPLWAGAAAALVGAAALLAGFLSARRSTPGA